MEKLKQAIIDWGDSFLSLVGAFLTGISFLSPAEDYGFITNYQMQILGNVLFFVFGWIAIGRAKISLNKYKNTLPKIIVSRPPAWELKEFVNKFRFAVSIEFINIANHPSESSAARNVSATIKWKDARGNLVTENHGRWHITNRQRGLGHNMQTVDIFPNNLEATLHFAIKSKDSQTLYAWYRMKDEADGEFELQKRIYKVEITLKDSRGMKWTFIYPVENLKLPEAPEKNRSDVAPTIY